MKSKLLFIAFIFLSAMASAQSNMPPGVNADRYISCMNEGLGKGRPYTSPQSYCQQWAGPSDLIDGKPLAYFACVMNVLKPMPGVTAGYHPVRYSLFASESDAVEQTINLLVNIEGLPRDSFKVFCRWMAPDSPEYSPPNL